MTAELVRDTGKILGQVAFKMGPNRLTGCRREERGPDSWTAFQRHGTGLEVGKHRCIPECWSNLSGSLAPKCSSADQC